ncbi:hypothetical protein Tco_1525395 [Tanacetum coccineum]
MKTPIHSLSTTDSQMHNNIMAADQGNCSTNACNRTIFTSDHGSYDYIDTTDQMGDSLRNAFHKVKVNILQQLQPEWSRFVTIVKQQHKLDEVSYRKLFDILKQYQKEVNELRAKRIAKNANSLALVAIVQPHQDPYYQTSKSHKSYAPTSKAPGLTSNQISCNYQTQRQREKPNQSHHHLSLASDIRQKLYKAYNNNLRTSSNTRNKNVDTTPRYKNDNQTESSFGKQEPAVSFGSLSKECKKPKQIKDSTYHKEKMLLCKQAEKGVQLQAEQSDWLADTDEEIDEQELEAHYSYMAKIQEVPNEDSGVDVEPLEQLEVDGKTKKIQGIKESKCNLAQELTECKSILAKLVELYGNLIVFGIVALIDELESDKAEFSNKYDILFKNAVSKDEREQYFEIQDLKAQLQDKNIAISELKKLIDKCKGKSVDTKFDKPSVVRQPNAQRIPKPS